jgi:hypothetical protein
MSRILGLVLLAGCSAGPPPVAPVAAVPRPPASEPHVERQLFRQLRVGIRPIARRTSFELVIEGDRASLVEIEEREQRALSMAQADREARWTVTARRTYRGTAATVAGALQLELSAEGVQPLRLRCAPRPVDVAVAGALRVPSPERPADASCDRGVWSPPTKTRVAALVCSAGGAGPDADDHEHHDEHDDHDDRLVFARPPGLEHAAVNDACALRGGGLRIAQ